MILSLRSHPLDLYIFCTFERKHVNSHLVGGIPVLASVWRLPCMPPVQLPEQASFSWGGKIGTSGSLCAFVCAVSPVWDRSSPLYRIWWKCGHYHLYQFFAIKLQVFCMLSRCPFVCTTVALHLEVLGWFLFRVLQSHTPIYRVKRLCSPTKYDPDSWVLNHTNWA